MLYIGYSLSHRSHPRSRTRRGARRRPFPLLPLPLLRGRRRRGRWCGRRFRRGGVAACRPPHPTAPVAVGLLRESGAAAGARRPTVVDLERAGRTSLHRRRALGLGLGRCARGRRGLLLFVVVVVAAADFVDTRLDLGRAARGLLSPEVRRCGLRGRRPVERARPSVRACLLYTSDAADE